MSTYVSLFARMAFKRSTGLRSFDYETLMEVIVAMATARTAI
jgi:hypothetical protein